MTTTQQLAYSRLRVLKAIQETGVAPKGTRVDTLKRLQDAGLIGPLRPSAGNKEEWFITQLGGKAIERSDIQQACKDLGRKMNDVLDSL
jgi:hypothetical protein